MTICDTHPLRDATNSVSTRHGTNSLHGLQAKTEPLRPGNNQRVHEEDAVCYWRSQVHDPQGTREHNVLLQSKKISGPRVQTRKPGIPRHIGYQDDMSISEVVASETGTLQNWTPSRAVSLPPQIAPRNETVTSGVQCYKVIYYPRRSDTRKEATSPTAIHCRRQRTGVGSGRDIR